MAAQSFYKIFHQSFLILKISILDWWQRDAFSQSAAIAFYAVFSLPGLLMIIMATAALGLEQQQAEAQIIGHIRSVLGPGVASNIKDIIDSTQAGNQDIWAFIVGTATLAFGATGLFAQLQKALNNIWSVEVKKSANLVTFLKVRAAGFGICISMGFLLLVSLAITAWITALSDWLAQHFSQDMAILFALMNYIFSLGFVSFLFATIYKILPDVHLTWNDVLYGGLLAGFMFTSGEYGLSFYFKIAQPETTFGTAGSLILILLWVFYSCLVLLYGAEFLRSYREYKDKRKPPPIEIAKRV
jgi:membrane protein